MKKEENERRGKREEGKKEEDDDDDPNEGSLFFCLTITTDYCILKAGGVMIQFSLA